MEIPVYMGQSERRSELYLYYPEPGPGNGGCEEE